MGVFKCAKCGCLENTALGLYWTRDYIDWYVWDETNEEYKGQPLCSECAPKTFKDGTKTGWGEWHSHFEKKPYDDFNFKK